MSEGERSLILLAYDRDVLGALRWVAAELVASCAGIEPADVVAWHRGRLSELLATSSTLARVPPRGMPLSELPTPTTLRPAAVSSRA